MAWTKKDLLTHLHDFCDRHVGGIDTTSLPDRKHYFKEDNKIRGGDHHDFQLFLLCQLQRSAFKATIAAEVKEEKNEAKVTIIPDSPEVDSDSCSSSDMHNTMRDLFDDSQDLFDTDDNEFEATCHQADNYGNPQSPEPKEAKATPRAEHSLLNFRFGPVKK